MKRYISFLIVVILIICIYLFASLKSRDYEVEYDLNEFKILEKYSKKDKLYTFNISNDDYKYEFISDIKYSNKRKIVKKIDSLDIKDEKDKCIRIKYLDYKTNYICSNGEKYFTPYYKEYISNKEDKLIKTIDNIEVYDKSYDYLLWDGYGITDFIKKVNHTFLDKESYDNTLSYKLNEYIVFADYDSNREFNSLYIYNNKTNKIDSMEFEYNISKNSYFMGDYNNYIYLFDSKNKVQYKINVKKKKIEIVSDKEFGKYYDNGWEDVTLNKLSHTEYIFNKYSLYQFKVDNNILIYNYYKTENNIIIDDEVTDIISVDNDIVYYLKEDKLYEFDINSGRKLLLINFEWNFSYLNKIYIFNNK